MNNERIESLLHGWRQVGVAYGGPIAESAIPVDLESLLLETARVMPYVGRLSNTTVTWLFQYGSLVAQHRLRTLAMQRLALDDRAPLGLVLEQAQAARPSLGFQKVLAALCPAGEPRPLLMSLRGNETLRQWSERSSGAIGRRWRLYIDDEPPRPKVLRARRWIMDRHPDFVIREQFNGDLRASVLASLWFDEGAGESETALAAACGGEVGEVRAAVADLEARSMIVRRESSSSTRFEALVPTRSALRS